MRINRIVCDKCGAEVNDGVTLRIRTVKMGKAQKNCGESLGPSIELCSDCESKFIKEFLNKADTKSDK